MDLHDFQKAEPNKMKRVWLYRIAIAWALMFSLVSLGASTLSAIVNIDWAKLNPQARLIVYITIFVSWGTTMMAFFSQAAKKIEEGQLPINGATTVKSGGDTTMITKAEITVQPLPKG